MTVTPISPGIIPVGFFDVSDADLPNISGGEILVFDVASVNAGETFTAEVYSETTRSNLRLADGYDTGPFFIASSDKTAGNIGFEKTSLYATNTAYAQSYDSSSKIGIFSVDGFYALTIDKFESGTVTTATSPNTKLYPAEGGLLTTVVSDGATQVAFFIEYRELNTSNYLNQPFTKFGMNRNSDTVIIYKSSR